MNRILKILIPIEVVVLIAIVVGFLFAGNKYSITVAAPVEEHVTVEYGQAYPIPSVTAVATGTIFHKKGLEIPVEQKGDVSTNELGTYEIDYLAEYKGCSAESKLFVTVVDTVAPVITLNAAEDGYVQLGETYQEEGYRAVDNYDGDITDRVEVTVGEDRITYTVSDSSGNTASVVREICYRDMIAPELLLNGDSELSIIHGESYEEPGYTASDSVDGDLTAQVVVRGSVDCDTVGSYELVYEVTDAAGNKTNATRKVTVYDEKPPVLKLLGKKSMYVLLGKDYEEPGYTATDALEGNLADKVTVSGKVNTDKKGVYTLTYTVKDSSGNEASAKRTVYVYKKQTKEDVKDPGDKVVYLTFDDGPSCYTEKLLDILDKYDVKVTFFVTAQSKKYLNLIEEEAKRGHTVAVHSYSHVYSKIYKSEEAFYSDIEKMNDIIEKQTGERTNILRFPGGASNTVSRKHCKGIMTALTKSTDEMGYLYMDWNVASGDTGGAKTSDEVAKNVIKGIKKQNVSVVLQHDIKKFSVEAVEEIIVWGLANGYTFLPIDETTPAVHHRVNN